VCQRSTEYSVRASRILSLSSAPRIRQKWKWLQVSSRARTGAAGGTVRCREGRTTARGVYTSRTLPLSDWLRIARCPEARARVV
jgi:hypothetical protein